MDVGLDILSENLNNLRSQTTLVHKIQKTRRLQSRKGGVYLLRRDDRCDQQRRNAVGPDHPRRSFHCQRELFGIRRK